MRSASAAATPRSGGWKPVPTTASRKRSVSSNKARIGEVVEDDFVRDQKRRRRELGKHRFGIALEAGGIAKKHDGDGAAGLGKVTGGDESIAAVVAFAAEDGDSVVAGIFAEDEAGDRRSGVFHQGGGGYAELLGREPVGFAHLACGEYFHSALDAIATGYQALITRASCFRPDRDDFAQFRSMDRILQITFRT